jgi:hypothetical protein
MGGKPGSPVRTLMSGRELILASACRRRDGDHGSIRAWRARCRHRVRGGCRLRFDGTAGLPSAPEMPCALGQLRLVLIPDIALSISTYRECADCESLCRRGSDEDSRSVRYEFLYQPEGGRRKRQGQQSSSGTDHQPRVGRYSSDASGSRQSHNKSYRARGGVTRGCAISG